MLSIKTATDPLGGENGRAKLLREVTVYILQVILTEGPVSRLIGAAAVPSTHPAQRLVFLAGHVSSGMD